MTITKTEYESLQQAYDFFNQELFGGKLPSCLITFQRKKNVYGYYSPHRFKGRLNKGARTDEIALNPGLFEGHTDEEILSTLVHEMTHQYQRLYGNPGRGRYHNREWATLMIERGLIPSRTGQPGGKQTGDQMDHYVKEGGNFQKACRKLLATGFTLNWQSVEDWHLQKGKSGKQGSKSSEATLPKRKKDRKKFTCPVCSLNAWAKPSAVLICGLCHSKSQSIQFMQGFWDNDWDSDLENWSDEELKQLDLVPIATPAGRQMEGREVSMSKR